MTTTSGGAGSAPGKIPSPTPLTPSQAAPPTGSHALERKECPQVLPGVNPEDARRRAQRDAERLQYARQIRHRHWQLVEEILRTAVKRRHGSLELTDDERLLIDLGLGDIQKARRGKNPGDTVLINRPLLLEVQAKGTAGMYYFSEWLAFRQQQSQLEHELNEGKPQDEQSYTGQLDEARRRVLARLTGYLTGLPGVPHDMAEMMRAGTLDKAVIASGIAAIKNPVRRNFLRRHRLWTLREQILSKARARAENQSVLRLFEMLNEVYVRDWLAHHDALQQGEDPDGLPAHGQTLINTKEAEAETDFVLTEMQRMRCRLRLLEAVDGREEIETTLFNDGPRLSKPMLAQIVPFAQAFDRTLTEMPPIVLTPGFGRGFFAWEAGCMILSVRPLIGTDDSLATALGWMRVLTDRFQGGNSLRTAYEAAFPGSSYPADFLADYRSWLCRLTKGDIGALEPDRRSFFRDHVGPDITRPLLPPNLRNVGPQTMMAICRRLEKQISAGSEDATLHRRLAMIYWQRDELEAAGLQFNAALQTDSKDGETLFSAGMFMRSRDDADAANACFKLGAEHAGDSMWGIYCRDALARLF